MGTASVAPCTSAEYYLQYHTANSGGVGEFYGEAAATLGFSGKVQAKKLMAAFEGLSPDGLIRYVELPGGENVRKPAWDITFSVPKSLSVLWSVCGPYDRDRIERVVMQAVKRAIDYIDSAALFTRRGKGGLKAEHAKGVYALFPHVTSRSLDPQIHVHALAINMCLRPDSSTGAIRSKDLYLHKMAIGAIFRTELAYLLLSELGLSLSRDSWKFEVEGVPKSLCQELSKRRQVIEERAKEYGWTDPRILAELAVITRGPKENVSLDECIESWRVAAEKHGFSQEIAEQLLAEGEKRKANRADQIPAHLRDAKLKELLRASVATLASRQSIFSERDILQQFATDTQALGFNANDIVAALRQGLSQFEYRVAVPGSDYCYYSTRENIACEKEILARAEHRRFDDNHLVTHEALATAKATAEARLSRSLGIPAAFTADQEACLEHITLEPGSIKLVQGYAGTGKTQLLAAANLAWKAAGYQVLGTAIPGRAAQALQKTTGIESITVAGLLQTLRPDLTPIELAELTGGREEGTSDFRDEFRTDYWMRDQSTHERLEVSQVLPDFWNVKQSRPSCQLTANTILVVDEAAMKATNILLPIMQECDKVGAKLVLVGDRLQLPAIEAGGPFTSLANRLGCATLTTLVRQRKEWMREAVTHLINNEPREALAVYAANEALRLEKHQRGAIQRLVAEYSQIEADDYSKSLALVSTKAEARIINEAIQTRRKASRQLGATFVTLPNGERVFQNDRILLTKNHYGLDVRNGHLGTVVDIHFGPGPLRRPMLTVALDERQVRDTISHNKVTITLEPNRYPHIQLGYAATTHKVAGITVEDTYVLLGDSMLNKEMAFTQLTRASHDTVIYGAEAAYGDSLDRLAQQMSRQTAKGLAHDYELIQQPIKSVRQGRERMQEAVAVLAPQHMHAASQVSASLEGVHLITSQWGAAQMLVNHYGKLASHEFAQSIAVTANDEDAFRINRGIQTRRKANNELGVDWIALPNDERVFKNDRVLLTVYDGLSEPVERLGTVVGFHRTRGIPIQISIRLDVPAHEHSSSQAQTVRVDARDFTDIQLGYALRFDKTRHISVETSLVLLGDSSPSSEQAIAQLSCASHRTTIYANRTQYGDSLRHLTDEINQHTANDLVHNHTIKKGLSYELSQSL